MNPIDDLFARLKRDGQKAFIPFLPAGEPDLPTTARLIAAVADAGASLIEVGFPFSDPIADGPVIAAAYARALARGIKLDDIFATLATVRTPVPRVAMASYSLIHRRGPAEFVRQALASGLSGAVVPDLPADEAEAFAAVARAADFKLILLVTPTTPPERAKRIAALCSGFLYCVSVTGITGERTGLPAGLADRLRWLRGLTDLPLCVGFGVSTPEQVAGLNEIADGVIVGTALVRQLGEPDPVAAAAALVRRLLGRGVLAK